MTSIIPKKDKRDLIIEAALQIFSQKGYHHTKMEEIAVAAGIGKGTIYEYFSSKLQLLQEIMEKSFHIYDHTIAADINKSLSLEERIRRLVEGHIGFCQNNKELTRILFLDTDIIDEELRNWAWQKRRLKEEHLQELFEKAMLSGEIKRLDAKWLTIMLSGIFTSFWIPIAMEGWEIDAAAAAQQVTDIIMRGIKQ